MHHAIRTYWWEGEYRHANLSALHDWVGMLDSQRLYNSYNLNSTTTITRNCDEIRATSNISQQWSRNILWNLILSIKYSLHDTLLVLMIYVKLNCIPFQRRPADDFSTLCMKMEQTWIHNTILRWRCSLIYEESPVDRTLNTRLLYYFVLYKLILWPDLQLQFAHLE
jgi:hypothetical protein